MKILLYTFKKLGIKKAILYLLLYPVRYLRKRLKIIDDLHDQMRWNKLLYHYLSKLSDHELNPLTDKQKQKVLALYGFLGTPINFDWFLLYKKLSGIESEKFIPDSIFFREIEPILNNHATASFYTDKNSYVILLYDYKQPETYLRYMHGKLFDSDYNQLSTNEAIRIIGKITRPWIIKPSVGSGGGKNIYLGKSIGGEYTYKE